MDGSIALQNNKGEVVRRWSFKNAWPVSWEGPQLNSGSSELAIETLEIAHDGLTVANG
jgi:phage tail-like protein